MEWALAESGHSVLTMTLRVLRGQHCVSVSFVERELPKS